VIGERCGTVVDGTPPTGGASVAFCNGLNTAVYGGRNNWYLPTQKELLMAYIDGIYSRDNVFTLNVYYWSSSEVSFASTYAWRVLLTGGDTLADGSTKSTPYAVRCVSRDL